MRPKIAYIIGPTRYVVYKNDCSKKHLDSYDQRNVRNARSVAIKGSRAHPIKSASFISGCRYHA